jgi:ABC-type multidrug transport system fused ATPase/permease subunit
VVGRTVLIVAHRLSTIRRATQIVVLDTHRIVDMGSHDELLKRCTKYQDLIKRQSMMHQGGSESAMDKVITNEVEETA